jgi:hypothetical protein
MVVKWYVGILLVAKPFSILLEHMVELFTCTWIKNSCNNCGNINIDTKKEVVEVQPAL